MTLVIHQTPAVHDEIADLLAALQRLLDLQVAVEIRLLSVSEACFERLGVNFEAAGDEDCVKTLETRKLVHETIGDVLPKTRTESTHTHLQMDKAFLTDSQVRELFEAVQGDRRTNLMQAPKLTLLNGQAGVVEIAETQYFVTNLNLDCKNGQVIANPTQEAFKFGVCLNVQPTVSADRKSILVNLKLKETGLVGPVPLIPVQIPFKKLDRNGKEKTKPEFATLFLQQPNVNTLAIENTSVIPDGQTLLLGGIKQLSEARNEFGPPVLSKIPYLNRFFKTVGYGRETTSLIIMVTPRIIVQAEEEQVPAPTSY
jgi:type II secretory pathway component GspD/PulD (secretin)